jgi:glycosyltransferase involved in cell wall biosynthesis
MKSCVVPGWDIYRKGLDIAIKAVSEARKQGNQYCFGISRICENIDDEKIEKIKKSSVLIQDRMRAVFRCMGRYVCPSQRCRYFLSASRTEAFSYAILEAISQNVPVLQVI